MARLNQKMDAQFAIMNILGIDSDADRRDLIDDYAALAISSFP